MAADCPGDVDPRSGFCERNRVFYSKRPAVALPAEPHLDVTTFLSSLPDSGGRVALVDACTGRCVTYPELWRAVRAVAAGLFYRHAVRKGHVVLILSHNSIDFAIVAFAVMSLGGVVTTANPLNTPGEIAKQVADCKARLVFTTSPLLAKLSVGPAASLPVVILGAEGNLNLPGESTNVVASVAEMMKNEATAGTSACPRPAEEQTVRQDDPATMLYSSGTTGTSKGVVSTHRNLISTARIIRNRYRPGESAAAGDKLVFVCTVPLFHVYGMAFFAVGLLGAGSTVVLLSKFGMDEMMSAVSTYRADYLPLVPPILVAMTKGAGAIRQRHDLSSLRKVLCGGSPLGKETIEAFLERYPGVEVLQGYGLTESTGIGASADTLEESRRWGTAGMLVPNTQARIVDPETGKPLPVNCTGELWLRGPYVMKGYFNNPEATASTVVSGGFLRTGDLCYINEEGYLFVVDRLKEVIKYKGYQVAPAELEALLLTHPEVSDAAVIPFPDKEVGEYPMAYAVRKEGSRLGERELMEYVAGEVAPYKRIRRVAFVAAIPKTASGKILRKDLIKLAVSKL